MANMASSPLSWWREMEPGLSVPAEGSPGDPGIYGPGSTTWHIGRERALLLGGGAALLLQIAHPLVAAGVADHSDFRSDPFARLRGTLEAMLAITFGDRAQAEAAAQRVAAVHAPVRGRLRSPAGSLAGGTAYRATDPELALWVHATLIFTALGAYERFVGPIRESTRARYYEETKAQAGFFGIAAADLPDSYADFRAYLTDMLESPVLTGWGQAADLAPAIFDPKAPTPLRAAARSMRAASAPFLPERLREEFGITWGPREQATLRAVASTLRRALPLMPAAVRYWPHYRIALRRMSGEPPASLSSSEPPTLYSDRQRRDDVAALT